MYSIGYLVRDLLNSSASDKPEPRNEIWASELGRPFIDRYLKMKGVPYSNPIDGTGLQNFLLGKSAEDAFVNLLDICKIPNSSQNKIVIKKDGCLDVTGRLDLLVGVPDWNKMLERIDSAIKEEQEKEQEETEKVFVYNHSIGSRYREEREKKDYTHRFVEKKQKLIEIVQKWQEAYPDGLPNKVAEVKTISMSAMKYNKDRRSLAEAYPQYALQLYAYMLGLGLDQGTLIFVVKGTGKNYSWFEEVVIQRSEKWDKMFWDDVQGFSKYFLAEEQPPLEPLFDEKGKVNWKINYSSYHDMLYKDALEKAKKEKDANKTTKTKRDAPTTKEVTE